MPWEGPLQLHTIRRGKPLEISLALLDNMHFGYRQIACAPWRFQRQPSALHDSHRRNNAKTCYCAPFRAYAANKKGDDASTDSQKHNRYDEGHSLPHDELASRNGLIIHTPIGMVQAPA